MLLQTWILYAPDNVHAELVRGIVAQITGKPIKLVRAPSRSDRIPPGQRIVTKEYPSPLGGRPSVDLFWVNDKDRAAFDECWTRLQWLDPKSELMTALGKKVSAWNEKDQQWEWFEAWAARRRPCRATLPEDL